MFTAKDAEDAKENKNEEEHAWKMNGVPVHRYVQPTALDWATSQLTPLPRANSLFVPFLGVLGGERPL